MYCSPEKVVHAISKKMRCEERPHLRCTQALRSGTLKAGQQSAAPADVGLPRTNQQSPRADHRGKSGDQLQMIPDQRRETRLTDALGEFLRRDRCVLPRHGRVLLRQRPNGVAPERPVHILSGQIGQVSSANRQNQPLPTLYVPAYCGGFNALLDRQISVTIPETTLGVVATSCRYETTSCKPMEKSRSPGAAPAVRDVRPGPGYPELSITDIAEAVEYTA